MTAFWRENSRPIITRLLSEVILTFAVAVVDPPHAHRGKPLPSIDPITICATSLRFYEELLFEAKSRFGR